MEQKLASSKSIRGTTQPATVRGALVVGLQKWLAQELTAESREALLATLPEEDVAVWRSRSLVNTSQHAAELFRRFGDALVRDWGRGDPRCLCDVGAFVAMNDLATYMKVLMKLGSPSFVSSRFPRIWDHYFSAGQLEVTARHERGCTVEIAGWQPYGVIGTFGAQGWMRAAIAYSGGKAVDVLHQTVGSVARYELRWS